tara:strand:+ start:1583 stop:1948 length:366 start_codon:yes stop_codon:yes gene_type:complete
MNHSDFNEMELQFEIKALRDKIKTLEEENINLRKVVEANDLTDELDELTISDEEYICVQEIKKLKELSDNKAFTGDDAKTLDILYKNLRMIRGLTVDNLNKKRKPKKTDTAQLFKIVEENK